MTLPDSLTTIGNKAFEHCHELTSIRLGKEVTVIGDSAFEFCFVLKEVELGPNVITIGRKAFASTRQVENATATSAGGSPDPDGEDSRRDR